MPTALALLGIVLLLMSVLIRAGVLGPNGVFALRTPATLRSDVAWWAGHRAVAGECALIGVAMLACAVIDFVARSAALGLLFLLLGMGALLHVGRRGDQAARAAEDG